MVRPTDKGSIHGSVEDVAVHTGHEVLMEVEDSSAPNGNNIRGIYANSSGQTSLTY
jgi:hypothetical protein